MPTAINGATAANSSIAAATRSAIGESKLDTDAFLQLLVTQLQNQDPLEPMSNENFLTQLAQFQSLQEQIDTASNTKNMLLAQELGAASALVGKVVTVDDGGFGATGVVEKVVVNDGEVSLMIEGQEYSLTQIKEVE